LLQNFCNFQTGISWMLHKSNTSCTWLLINVKS
jgi:hypothetical protein